jgi:aspartyl-tRNA(Asn)/glutamyl-tRNA(Gln) amidotransferase subunit A
MNGSIASIASDVQNKISTATAQVEGAIARAKEKESYNALISLQAEMALKKAAAIDKAVKSGKKVGSLAGVPFVVKDNYLVLDTPTTAASKFLTDFPAPLTATAVEKLEIEGAICIGKANLDAFANGGSTENSAYGPTKNAHDPSRVAGGTSGGSAVAVALDIVPFALGSDTGGSIRQPSGFNGVVGVKPTYGAVSRFGIVAMASSFDCMGPITKNIADAELILDIMAGQDDRDSTTLPNFFIPLKNKKTPLKIGVIKEFLNDAVEEQVRKQLNGYIQRLQKEGHIVEEVSIPTLPHALAMYYIIMPAELMSNLARYDGVRFGQRKSNQTLSELYGQSRDYGFETENKRRILIGSYVLSSGYYDAYYNHAQKARTLLINDYAAAFKKYDVLLSPVSPTPAFKIGEKMHDPIQMYLADTMTVPPSLAGLPAISVPCGETTEGLPVGVQLIGPQKSDATLLNLAKAMEVQNG